MSWTLSPPSGSSVGAWNSVCSGNIYVADTSNNVVREIISATGLITPVAGTGVAGFSGDGGPARQAQLDTPHGLAVDASGNLYIGAGNNHRVREVVASTGIITTVAGNGASDYSGDRVMMEQTATRQKQKLGDCKMKKLPYREGDWFAVPLGGGGFAVGLVTRMASRGAVLFGYFFGPRRPDVPSLSDMRGCRPEDAILVEIFGDPALRQGEWPVLGRIDPWDRKMWPMPAFGRIVKSIPGDHAAAAWRVEYPDDNPNGVPRETRITVEEAQQLPPDGLSGAKAVQMELTRLLGTTDDVTRLTASLPSDPKPDQPTIDYFIYFPTQAAAMRVALRLESEGYTVEVRDSRDMDAGWLTLAKHTLPAHQEELDAAEAHMEELAAAEGGNYDGYERDVPSGAKE